MTTGLPFRRSTLNATRSPPTLARISASASKLASVSSREHPLRIGNRRRPRVDPHRYAERCNSGHEIAPERAGATLDRIEIRQVQLANAARVHVRTRERDDVTIDRHPRRMWDRRVLLAPATGRMYRAPAFDVQHADDRQRAPVGVIH
jgi:hypothetical protein